MSVRQAIIIALGLSAASSNLSYAGGQDPANKNTDPFANTSDPFANEADPFAQEQDPFAQEQAVNDEHDSNEFLDGKKHQSRVEIKSYYQNNEVRKPHALNPGLNLFNQYNRFVGLDMSLTSQWSENISTHGRLFSRYMAGSGLDSPDPQQSAKKDHHSTHLLEGSLQWQNQSQDIAITVGRVKPTWSNGYNYDIANFLKPHGNLPYIDQDNPLQHKGWDMIQAQYFFDRFTLSGYLIESRLDENQNHNNINHEAVIRLGYQDDHEFSLMIHKYDHGKASYAATFNTSVNDNTTLRAEYTNEPQRRLAYYHANYDTKNRYQRFVIGTTYTSLDSWSLTAELFYNQHGVGGQQWQQLYNDAKHSAEQINTGQSQDWGYDINQALNGINFLSQGWTGKRYGSLMFSSAQSEDLWQLRLSTQVNLVDSSRLYRLEVLKSVNDNLSARLEYQRFSGCENCEYGLNPYEHNLRLTASWLF